MRAPVDGEGGVLLARQEFRRYTREYTLLCERLDLWPAPLPEHLEFRARRPADAWGIFQLYCSVAPPQVRHAEGLSSKRWTRGSKLAHALVGRWLHVREVVLTDEGLIVGWVRLAPIKGHAAQRLEVMLHPARLRRPGRPARPRGRGPAGAARLPDRLPRARVRGSAS